MSSKPRPITAAANNQDHDLSADKNLPVRAYLDKTVVPLLLQALSECSKVRPEDPIEFIADYLHKHNTEKK